MESQMCYAEENRRAGEQHEHCTAIRVPAWVYTTDSSSMRGPIDACLGRGQLEFCERTAQAQQIDIRWWAPGRPREAGARTGAA